MRRFGVVIIVLALGVALLPASGAGANGVIRYEFEKELVAEGIWSGSVDSDGGIRTILTEVVETGNVWHLSFQWHVFEVPTPFSAEVSGVLNLKTGKVALNGEVMDGDLQGSNLIVDAQLDLSDFSSAGTMTLTP